MIANEDSILVTPFKKTLPLGESSTKLHLISNGGSGGNGGNGGMEPMESRVRMVERQPNPSAATLGEDGGNGGGKGGQKGLGGEAGKGGKAYHWSETINERTVYHNNPAGIDGLRGKYGRNCRDGKND